MRDEQTLRLRHQAARPGQELETDLSALQPSSQEENRSLPQRDDWTGAIFVGLDRSWGFDFPLPQLRLEGSR
jgi:hypothetical protein